MLGFEIVIYWSDGERVFIAEAPNCPGAWRTPAIGKPR